MAVSDVHRNRFARELLNGDLMHAQQAMTAGAIEYKRLESLAITAESGGNQAKADSLRETALSVLRRNVQLPILVKYELQRRISTRLIKRFGSRAAAIAFVDSALANYQGGLITRAQIMNHLDSLIAVANACIDGFLEGGWSLDRVADYVLDNVDDIDTMLTKDSDGYVQRWR